MSAPQLLSAVQVSPTEIELTFDQVMDRTGLFVNTSSYSISPTITLTGVTLPANPARVRLTLQNDPLDNQLHTVTASTFLQNVSAEPMDPSFRTASFTAVGDGPVPILATAISFTEIDVQFDEDVDANTVEDRDQYILTSELTGKRLELISVALQASDTIRFTIVPKMSDGQPHTARFLSGVADVSGNTIVPDTEIEFTGLAELPKADSFVLSGDGNELIITFSEPMDELNLQSLNAYTFIEPADGFPVYYTGVDVSNDRTQARIQVTEQTIGKVFTAKVEPLVTDDFGNSVDLAFNSGTFTGIGIVPTIQSVIATSKNRVDVLFDDVMANTTEIRDPSRYTWNGGLKTLSVIDIVGPIAMLATTDQTPGFLYTLTIE